MDFEILATDFGKGIAALAWLRLLILASLLVGIALIYPTVLSDENEFLKDFLDNDLLSTLGFIAAVTLASIGNMHLQIRQFETEREKNFPETKKSLKLSAGTLIILFAFAFILVVVKPLLPCTYLFQGLANSVSILIVYVYLEVLWDITFATFKV